MEKYELKINEYEDRLWDGKNLIDIDVMSHLFKKKKARM